MYFCKKYPTLNPSSVPKKRGWAGLLNPFRTALPLWRDLEDNFLELELRYMVVDSAVLKRLILEKKKMFVDYLM